jgi:hypothetical protein
MRAMQDMQNVIRGLGELSKRSFAVTPEIGRSIGEAMAHMQGSLEALEGRNGYGASQEEGQSMSSLNKTATQLQGAMQNMMKQGSGSGMGGLLQQLQMMAGQQQSINAQTQSMQQAAEAARLAVEQEAVRKSLEQLNKEAQASGEQKNMLGDLDKIAEEMKEVVQNLTQNNVNPETVRKQERILSRLLDASKSMHERDYEKKRKATTGTQIVRRGPGELDPSLLEGKNKLLEDLLKSLEHGYSKDYQELIRKHPSAPLSPHTSFAREGTRIAKNENPQTTELSQSPLRVGCARGRGDLGVCRRKSTTLNISHPKENGGTRYGTLICEVMAWRCFDSRMLKC